MRWRLGFKKDRFTLANSSTVRGVPFGATSEVSPWLALLHYVRRVFILFLLLLPFSYSGKAWAAPKFSGRLYYQDADLNIIPLSGIAVDGWGNNCADHLTGIPCDAMPAGCTGECGGTDYVEACAWVCKTDKASCQGESCWNPACNQYIPQCTDGGKRCELYREYAFAYNGKNCSGERIVKWLTWDETDENGEFEIHSANLGCLPPETAINFFSPAENPQIEGCLEGHWEVAGPYIQGVSALFHEETVAVAVVQITDNVTNKDHIDFEWVCTWPTPTPTVTSVPSATPLPSETPTPTATPLPTTPPGEPTSTPVPTATSTPVPTVTPLPTQTPIPTATPTSVPAATVTPTPTSLFPTPTPTPQASCACWLLAPEGSPDLSQVKKGQELKFVAKAYAPMTGGYVSEMIFELDTPLDPPRNKIYSQVFKFAPGEYTQEEINGETVKVYTARWSYPVPNEPEAEGLYHLNLIIHCDWEENYKGEVEGVSVFASQSQASTPTPTPTPTPHSPSFWELLKRLFGRIIVFVSPQAPTLKLGRFEPQTVPTLPPREECTELWFQVR